METEITSTPKSTNFPYVSISDFCENFSLDEKEVLNIYVYGSRVYGTASENSDWDFIVVISTEREQDQHPGKDENDVTVYGEKQFSEILANHQQNALECIFLPKDKIIQEKRKFQVTIDVNTLRHSFSKLVANSWSKASKKLTIEKDLKRAKKGLFHSMRILMFGSQIAEHGKIIDYAAANYLWDEIKAIESNQWEDFFTRYKKTWNSLKSEFRKVAPMTQEDKKET